jgi:hypothetical protein
MPLQKIFLLPPLKGLNLYDNPFTMSPDFAVELENFMPPTTTFTVRPGVKFVAKIEGQVRGLYSYTTGKTVDYGQNWFFSNIKYGAAKLILIKAIDKTGITSLYSLDSVTNSLVYLGKVPNSNYNDDSALYKHTMFFLSGATDSVGFMYHQNFGIANFTLSLGEDGHQTVGDMQCVTMFKNKLFMSGGGSLNIFWIDAKYADVLSPLNSYMWQTIENLFSPHFGESFTLDGLVQNGGSIIKLANMSRGGSDSISTYLMAITDMGEIILFDGTNPKDTTGKDWVVSGRFQIPPPLNRWAMCEMDGDYVVATKNGLISLRRVLFGQASAITENLEFRLMSLFSKYMFQMPSMSDFISLYYHPRNRLLIFNVPTMLPIPFNKLVQGYEFNESSAIVFRSSNNGLFDDSNMSLLKSFIQKYLLYNFIDYTLTINLSEIANQSYIKCNVSAEYSSDNSVTYSFSLMYKFSPMNEEFPLLITPIQFYCPDIYGPYTNLTQITDPSQCGWSKSLKSEGVSPPVYSLRLNQGSTFSVVDVSSKSFRYASQISRVTLADFTPPASLSEFSMIMMMDYFYNLYKDNANSTGRITLNDFYNSSAWGIGAYHEMKSSATFHNSECRLSPAKNYLSPLKMIVSVTVAALQSIFGEGGRMEHDYETVVTFQFKMNFSFDSIEGKIHGEIITLGTLDAKLPESDVSYYESVSMNVTHSLKLYNQASPDKELASYHITYPINIIITKNIMHGADTYKVEVKDGHVDIVYNNKEFILNLAVDANFDSVSGEWTVTSHTTPTYPTPNYDENLAKKCLNALGNMMPTTFGNTQYEQNLAYLLSNFGLFANSSPTNKDYIVIFDQKMPLNSHSYNYIKFADYMYSETSQESIYLEDFFKQSKFGVTEYSGEALTCYYNNEQTYLAPLKCILLSFYSAYESNSYSVDSYQCAMTYTMHAKYLYNNISRDLKLIITVAITSYDQETRNVAGTISFLYQYSPDTSLTVNYNLTAHQVGNTAVKIEFNNITHTGEFPLEINFSSPNFSFSFINTSKVENVPQPDPESFGWMFGSNLSSYLQSFDSIVGWSRYKYLFGNLFLSKDGTYPPLPTPPIPPTPVTTYYSMGNMSLNESLSAYNIFTSKRYFLNVHFDNYNPDIVTETTIDSLMKMGTNTTYHEDPGDDVYLDPINRKLKSVVLCMVSALKKSLEILLAPTEDEFSDKYGFFLQYKVNIVDDNLKSIDSTITLYVNIMPIITPFDHDFDVSLYIFQKVSSSPMAIVYFAYYKFMAKNLSDIYQLDVDANLVYADFYSDINDVELVSGDHPILNVPDQDKWNISVPLETTPPSWMLDFKDVLNNVFFDTSDKGWTPGFSWMFNNLVFANIVPPNNRETKRLLPKEATSQAELTPTFITNIDLASIPLLSLIDIFCNYESTQYVFDSHFGTWSSFNGINMIKGLEHANDFYFVIPNDLVYDDAKKTYTYANSSLCRFDPSVYGDNIIENQTKSIIVSYKTVSTFDFGIPQKKILKRIKIFGSPSAFWVENSGLAAQYPFIIKPFSDFKEGMTSVFVHAFDIDSLTQKILKSYFGNKSHITLSPCEKKKFLELYQEENDKLAQISIPLIANPGTRFGFNLEMEVKELAVNIYGFEISFDPTNQIL